MRELVIVTDDFRLSLPRIILDISQANDHAAVGFVSLAEGPIAGPIPCLGGPALLEDASFINLYDFAIAAGQGRRKVGEALLARGGRIPPMIHPAATIASTATIGDGTVVSAGVVVAVDTRIGRFCSLNTGCSVDHDNVVGDGVSIAPGARTAGSATILDNAFVGLGAVISNRVTVGVGATVGAGAVVIRDVADGATVVGNPARPLAKPSPG